MFITKRKKNPDSSTLGTKVYNFSNDKKNRNSITKSLYYLIFDLPIVL